MSLSTPILANQDSPSSPSRSFGAFRAEGRIQPVLVLVFFLINAVVLLNAVLHPPTIGYDAHDHLRYVTTLAEGRLVTPADSAEFFSPPLPYLFPAALMRVASLSIEQAAKAAQLLNVLVSIGLTLFLLRICELIDPGKLPLKLGTLSFLGVLPVYYKTFAFVRGEPFVAFFAVLAVFYALQMAVQRRPTLWHATALGVALGLAGFSRQWGLLLLPAIAVWAGIVLIKTTQQRKRLLALLTVSLVIGSLLGSWFYLSMSVRFGSVTAFNRTPQGHFAIANQPSSFYFGLGDGHLFTDPLRSAFPNQLVPILYSETWGDYWGYFVVYGKDTRSGQWVDGHALWKTSSNEQSPDWLQTNRLSIAPLLGRANLVGLFPTLLALAAYLLGVAELVRFLRQSDPTVPTVATSLLVLVVAASFAGYLWFLIMYPNRQKGDTIKSTYLLHVFPMVALLVGVLLQHIRQRSRPLYLGVITGLALVYLHNLPLIITRFVAF